MSNSNVVLTVNGRLYSAVVDTRTTLLDLLREQLQMPGTKKGCDHGLCGACTVTMDGHRVVSCLTLAVSAGGSRIVTIEGIADGENLHPVQSAFLHHDGFQCGYCTPGQICSAVALIEEHKRRELSVASFPLHSDGTVPLTDAEIRERMSGNLCRCGAYPNIVAAIRQVANGDLA
jgi:xanthine dehydrogenase YagT iron-sulfur-binding subunit